jgi:hypothetical protein
MTLNNPYTPGAGRPPAYLAGRDNVKNEAIADLDDLLNGYIGQSKIYYGLRGVGKTVLLNAIEEEVEKREILYEHIEISENDKFKDVISLSIIQLFKRLSLTEKAKDFVAKAIGIMKAFNATWNPQSGDFTVGFGGDVAIARGTADTGNFQYDLTELFVALGNLAKKLNKPICFFIDEIQYLKESDFEGLIGSVHRLNQKNLPIIFFGSGLPKIAKYTGDIKSYAERLFRFIPIDSLREQEAKSALIEPAKALGVIYDDSAISAIIKITAGYPYFIQEFGRQVWQFVKNQTITAFAIEEALPLFYKSLDESFFKMRYDRANSKEKEFMYAMVACGELPCTLNNVAKIMQSKVERISPIRAKLISKGFVYATGYGEIDFTVPQFDLYLERLRGK